MNDFSCSGIVLMLILLVFLALLLSQMGGVG